MLAQVTERGGRGVVSAILVFGETLDSTALKSVPVGRLEAVLNHPEWGPPVLRVSEDDLREFAKRKELFPDEFAQIDEALASYRAKAPETPTTKYRAQQAKRRQPARPPLTRPTGTDPEDFYRRVADAYNDVVITTSAPAPMLAEEAGVPVATVHRWIAEARRRGFLPPARKGRAG